MYPRRILLYYFTLTLLLLAENSFSQQIKVYAKHGMQTDTLHLEDDSALLQSILRHYQLKAFFQVDVDSIAKTSVDSYSCQVNLGSQAGPIRTRFIEPGKTNLQTNLLTPTEYLARVEEELNSLRAQGYYRSRIEPHLQTLSDTLEIDLYIYKGVRNSITRIEKQGYLGLSETYLKYRLGISPGILIADGIGSSKQSRWEHDPIIEVYREPDLLFYPDSTVLYFYSKKRKANSFDALMGLNTDNRGRVQLNGYADIRLLNSFDRAEEIKLYWKNNGNGRQDLNIQASLPYFLSSSTGLMGNIAMTTQDSSWFSLQLSAGLRFTLNYKDQIRLKGHFEKSNSSAKIESLASYTKKGMEISWVREGEYLNMLMGPSYSFQSSVAYKLRNDGRNTSQVGAALEYETTRRLHQQHYIYAALDAYWINMGEVIYDNELRRIGGFQSIRGFKELQIATSTYGIGRFEYRYLSGDELYLFSITDAAHYQNPLVNKDEWLLGMGAGLSLSTKAGQFSLAWALGKFQSEALDFAQGKLHFGYINRF